MLILGVDTAGEGVSLALGDGLRVWSSRRRARSAEAALWPALEALLKKAGKRLEDLGAVACIVGPGRFTAVRLGVTFSDMLARTRAIPAVGLTRFEACAPSLPERDGVYALVVPAPREESYLQLWRRCGKRVAAEAPPGWAAAGALESAAGGAPRLDASSSSARELLAPARRLLASRRRAPLRPLYLKPANYAK